jgi:hypothetical protein
VNGNYAVVIGASAGATAALPQAGPYSIAIGSGGDSAGRPGAQTDDTFGVAIGTGAFAGGVRSTSVGAFAGLGSANAGNNRNSFFGVEAGQNVTGGGNTATGLASGVNVTGDLNSALGNSAGVFVTGDNNTAAGVLAGVTVNGSSNVAYGERAGGEVDGDSNIAIGPSAGSNITASNTVAVGTHARASANRAIAIGALARATKGSSVAIGYNSLANAVNTISVGRAGHERRIVNVAPAINPTDAVTLGQVQALVAWVAAAAASRSEAVAAVYPELITETGEVPGVRDHGLIRLLLNELQRQQGELADLRARVEQLQAGSAGALERRPAAADDGEHVGSTGADRIAARRMTVR